MDWDEVVDLKKYRADYASRRDQAETYLDERKYEFQKKGIQAVRAALQNQEQWNE